MVKKWNIIITITKNSKIVIQIGDNTHHQDQSMQFVSFNTIKAIVNSPLKPMLLPFCFLFIVLFIKLFTNLPISTTPSKYNKLNNTNQWIYSFRTKKVVYLLPRHIHVWH